MKLYNTLSREKEEFVPLGKVVTMYSCGPTVYNYAHIGNLRTYVFMDLLRRVLKYNHFKVKGVLNITDVGHLQSDADEGEDKMEKASRERKQSPEEIAKYFTDIFLSDIARLNIGRPEILAKATDHIKEMIDYCVALVELGYAYETSDGIYFDIGKFPDYGKLSRLNLDDQIAGARVEVNTEKHHPADFAIWKKASPTHIMQWDSPWGKGYPGWHIECSAMSKKYLGKVMDIHSGGVDHIPVHHENEIAQSEALEQTKTVNYWMHGEFMLVDGGKMSKSLGNTYTIDQLLARGYSPLVFRYFCLNAHYRKKLNFTFEGLDGSKTAYSRLSTLLASCRESTNTTAADKLAHYKSEFENAINDDLNIPLALGTLWTMTKEPASRDIYNLALEFDKVLGLDVDKMQKADDEQFDIPPQITELANQRKAARDGRDWKQSDVLRAEIQALGYEVIDKPDGYKIVKK